MQFHVIARRGALALVLTCSGCGGGSSGSPNAPKTLPTPSSGPSIIAIVGNRGAQSFSPNPAPEGQNQMVVWRNSDNVTHRIVLNDGTFDTGDIAPGASTAARQLSNDGVNYHCSIHPGMVGSVMASSGAPPPPCTGYCKKRPHQRDRFCPRRQSPDSVLSVSSVALSPWIDKSL
jgi:plastocyanin